MALGDHDAADDLREYPASVGPKIGLVVSRGKATLVELETVLGTEDLEDLVDIILVDLHNARAMARKAEEES